MTFETTWFALVALVAAWISSLAAILVGPRRHEAPGGRALFWLLLATTLWSAAAAVELSLRDLTAKIAWSKIQYLGTLSAPPLFALFAARFARSRWLRRERSVALLFAVPAVTFLLAFTNEWHGLIWPGYRPNPQSPYLVVFERGWGFWVGVVGYSYLCLAAGTALLARAAVRLPRAIRRQAVSVLAASAIPWVANASYIFGVARFEGLDPTPLSIAAMGALCVLTIFHFRLVDLVPAARAAAVRGMGDGLIVFDEQRRVIDVNPAARRMLGGAAPAVGVSSTRALAPWPELVRLAASGQDERVEIAVPGEPARALEVEVTRLPVPGPRSGPAIVLLRDISERQRAARELSAANDRLAAQLHEISALQESLRDQAVRDALTGLYNRRYLDETLGRELSRVERSGEPLAIVLLDLDNLKELNDRLGHAAGDVVLRDLGALLRAKTRKADIACRYGGDEFLVAMPGTDAMAALERAEDLHRSFAALFVPDRDGRHCTLSAGVAEFPLHAANLESLLACADLALYAAKGAGRNRVVLAS